MTTQKKKSYQVKEWFMNKISEQISFNCIDNNVFNIFKETEKAVYAMVSIAPMKKKTLWIPKSCLEEFEIGVNNGSFEYHHETYFIENYDEASLRFKNFWSDYM